MGGIAGEESEELRKDRSHKTWGDVEVGVWSHGEQTNSGIDLYLRK